MRVLLYGDWPLALTYLDPLAAYIRQHEPSWQISYGGNIGRAPDPITNPQVVITCDELSVAPDAPIKVCIFHGLASKGQAFSSARRNDFVNRKQDYAVPSTYYQDILLDMGVERSRIFVAGLTKFDAIQPKVLYAPTHNPQLSAIPVIKERIYDIPGVKVHLHMYTRTGEKPHHQEFRSYYPRHEDREDIADLISWADVVIGDMGSIVIEALALGKRGIQVRNPRWREFYQAKGIPDDELERLPEVHFAQRYGRIVETADDAINAAKGSSGLAFMPTSGASAKIVEWVKKKAGV